MSDEFTNPTPDNGSAATAERQPAPTNGTVQNGSEAGANGQGAPSEESFTRLDPNTLPPQLRQSYDNMLRDYKEKTTKLSETVKSEVAKATEAHRAKAEFYDQIAAREDFVQRWNEYVQQAQASGQKPADGDPVLSEMKQQLEQMNQKIQMSELTQITEAFADAQDEKGQKVHPEFNQLNSLSIGQLNNGNEPEDFSLLRGAVELAPGNSPQEKLANGYKAAKAVYDSIFEAGKKAGMGRLQTKLLNGTNPPSNSGTENLQMTDKKPKNAREAIALAKRGIAVSRD